MCSINHDLKAIYLHIPKTGGSYISSVLTNYYGFKNYYLKRPDHNQFCKIYDSSVDKHENKLYGTYFFTPASDSSKKGKPVPFLPSIKYFPLLSTTFCNAASP